MPRTNHVAVSPEGSSRADAGSFRDRDGRVYRAEGRIFRGISAGGLENFETLNETRFYARFRDEGTLLGGCRVDPSEVPLSGSEKEKWAAFIEQPLVPVISYPYEWTFGMLRDAALLQLELTEAAIREGIGLKDATPYNIQFMDGRPVFIDLGSFESHPPGGPWAGYRQFCEMFLFPLMFQVHKGIDFQPLMRGDIDGIPVQCAARVFGICDRWRPGVLTHVWLQSRFDRSYGSARTDVRTALKSAGFNREMILSNLRKLRRLIRGFHWKGKGSEWADYESFHNYSDEDSSIKEEFVERCVAESGARIVWDIGCNTGRFSRIAAQYADCVLAMDQDHLAVEKLYRELREEAANSILTLVQNVADPSPNWGWCNRERSELSSRAKPDLVLCLALIHHVVISANIPLEEFIDWLANLSDQVVIEHVSRGDEKVQALLRNKSDKYSDYGREQLEAALQRHFEILRQQRLQSGNRYLYWCRRRAGT